jgi:hypothetical protein
MKLVMTLLVRDEEDIIEANIDFHLAQGVDFIIAMDNLSTDETARLLRRYESLGVLHYIFESDDNYMQHRWVTRMARLAATQFAADWVINSDADEFWYPEDGDLKQALESISDSSDAVIVPRTNFLPVKSSQQRFFADEMTIRERESFNVLGEPLPGKVCHRAYSDIDVDQGNHIVRRRGVALQFVPAPVTILHFPMRSYDQYANKIELGGAAYARNHSLPAGAGKTWKYLYQILRQGELQQFFEAHVSTSAEIDRRLQDGSLLRDYRLSDFFKRLRHHSPNAPAL